MRLGDGQAGGSFKATSLDVVGRFTITGGRDAGLIALSDNDAGKLVVKCGPGAASVSSAMDRIDSAARFRFGGAGTLELDQAAIGGNTRIVGKGAAGLAVIAVNSTLTGRLDANFSGGNDLLLMSLCSVGKTRVRCGSGNDEFSTPQLVQFLSDLTVICGAGNDAVDLAVSSVAGKKKVNPGAGTDTVK